MNPVFFDAKNPLLKKNYRPVSVLQSLSNVFEKLLLAQMQSHIDFILNDRMLAFRAGFSCQHVPLAMVERWRGGERQSRTKKLVGAVLVDLSKGFDCLPHPLLIAKLRAYGFSESATILLANYLSKQRVKIGNSLSTWKCLVKGVPQGSILGPAMLNIFMNDVFCVSSQRIFSTTQMTTLF